MPTDRLSDAALTRLAALFPLSPPPWVFDENGYDIHDAEGAYLGDLGGAADDEYAVEAVNALPALVAEVQRLRAVLRLTLDEMPCGATRGTVRAALAETEGGGEDGDCNAAELRDVPQPGQLRGRNHHRAD